MIAGIYVRVYDIFSNAVAVGVLNGIETAYQQSKRPSRQTLAESIIASVLASVRGSFAFDDQPESDAALLAEIEAEREVAP